MNSTQENRTDLDKGKDSEERIKEEDNNRNNWESPAWWNKPKVNPGDEFIFWGY